MKKSSGTLYWTGTGSDTLAESDLTAAMQKEYIFFNGKRVARRDLSDGTVKYYFSDHLGSASIITNASGAMPPLEESDYYPYGGEIAINAADPNTYKFNGKERDAESGLDEFGARYYASSLGRFMIPDWAAKPTAVPYANFGNPQSLNLYNYVQNNPTTLGDPDGHVCGDPSPNSSNTCTKTDTSAAAQENLAQSWLNVVEVSGSYGWSVGVSGQAGSEAEYEGTGGVTVEGTIGLGGGNGEVKVSGDVVNGKLKLGEYEGSVKSESKRLPRKV